MASQLFRVVSPFLVYLPVELRLPRDAVTVFDLPDTRHAFKKRCDKVNSFVSMCLLRYAEDDVRHGNVFVKHHCSGLYVVRV